ncbi:MAG: NUDIX hydrolase [Acidobacteriota bacterium]|nr:MAG: NUDIX hydrolase [Acidobacteriota bacterium]
MTKFTRGNLVSQREVYQGRIIDLVVDDIEVNGFETVREVVRHPGGVVVLAEVEPDRIPFVRQHRYPLNKDLLELPAGKLDSGEPPEISAARELEEETGYQARSIRHICSFYSSPGFCDELLHFYYTDDVSKSEMQTEIDEEIELEFYSLDESLAMIDSGEILDGKTITAILWLDRNRRKLE